MASSLPKIHSNTQQDAILRHLQERQDARAIQHPPDHPGRDFRSTDRQWSFRMVSGCIAN